MRAIGLIDAVLGQRGSRTTALALRPPTDARVLAFAHASPSAGPFHHPAWGAALTDAYGYPGHVLTLEDGAGGIVAALPVMHVRSWLTGERLVGLPFTDHCPPLLLSGTDGSALSEALAALAREVPVEVRAELPDAPGITSADVGWRHVLDLRDGLGSIEARLHRTPVGRALRRARRSGLGVEISSAPDALAEYHRLHCLTRRRLGVPPQPRRFFTALQQRVLGPGLGFVVLARHAGEAVAGAVFLDWNRRLVYKYAASDAAHWPARPNQLVLWAAIEWACRNGRVELDLGRTEPGNHGLREFKRRWGAHEVPLRYSSVGTRRRSSPAPGVASSVLRALPAPVARAVGEVMYRHIA